MTKNEILKIIVKSAKLYSEHLENKNMLFLYKDKTNKINYFEAVFDPRQFQHFTGTRIVNKNIKSKTEFYNMCLNNNLTEKDFEITKDGTTRLKMEVLPYLMTIYKVSNMVCAFDSCGVKLQTEKLVGNVKGCMGFVQSGKYFVPNTILNGDIRKLSNNTSRLLVVYSKMIKDQFYTNLCYVAKGIDILELKIPEDIKELIDMGNLTYDFKQEEKVKKLITNEGIA